MPSTPHTASPTINIPSQSGPFVTIDASYGEHHHHPSLWFTLMLLLFVVRSKSLDKCIRTCIHHYSVIQNGFTALKIPCAPPVHPSSFLIPHQQ